MPLEDRFLNGPWKELQPTVEDVRATVRNAGLWAPQLPQELSGMGLPLLDFALDSGAFEPVAIFGVAGCDDEILFGDAVRGALIASYR